MLIIYSLGAVVAASLLVYLAIALLKPEIFP
ncbi:MAG: potassium-transporting ATPase subunit F [Rickettsiales bacterium]